LVPTPILFWCLGSSRGTHYCLLAWLFHVRDSRVCERFLRPHEENPLGSPPHAQMHSYYALASDVVPQSRWVQFLLIAVFIVCMSPPDDPFIFADPFLV